MRICCPLEMCTILSYPSRHRRVTTNLLEPTRATVQNHSHVTSQHLQKLACMGQESGSKNCPLRGPAKN